MEKKDDIDASWDAGAMGCGEPILNLRLRMKLMPRNGHLHLVARDPGAIEDLPAWCRMTRHRFEHVSHPVYRIRRIRRREE